MHFDCRRTGFIDNVIMSCVISFVGSRVLYPLHIIASAEAKHVLQHRRQVLFHFACLLSVRLLLHLLLGLQKNGYGIAGCGSRGAGRLAELRVVGLCVLNLVS